MKRVLLSLFFFASVSYASGTFEAPKKKEDIPYFNLQQGKILKIVEGKEFSILTVKLKKGGTKKIRVPVQTLYKGDMVEYVAGRDSSKIPFVPYMKVLNRTSNQFVRCTNNSING